MKTIYTLVIALLVSISAFAQNDSNTETQEEMLILCKMPNTEQGQWLKLKTPTRDEVSRIQDQLVYLQLLDENKIGEKGVMGTATSDAILRLEKRNGVTYNANFLEGLTQGMKNRINLAYFKTKRAADKRSKKKSY